MDGPDSGGPVELFGRQAETDEVIERLATRRLVTICGPGGIGKTALARAVADRLAADYDLGSIVVDLTRVDDEDAVFEALAGQLGYADFDSLRHSSGQRSILVVVDNCEHVLDATAQAMGEMLEADTAVRVIATSRTPIDLPEESLVLLAPLPTPAADVVDPEVPSMRLLAARARDHGVHLGPEDQETAAGICRRLDGMPLAIEIAAARLRTVGVGDLRDQLDEAPHALARRRFRGRPQHRSVAEVVDWSWRLLDDRERRAFERLGVFAGPFTSSLARPVVLGPERDGDEAGPDWDDLLDGLVSASLVTVDRTVEPTRYRLLHPVRAVALDHLERSGEAVAVRSRLIDEIIARTLEIVRGGPRGWRPDNLHGLLDLYDNTAASIRWLLDNDDEPDRALVLVAALWGIVHNAHSTEIHGLGEAVLARWPDPAISRWSNAAATVATCRFLRGDTAGAIELAEAALPGAERSRSAPALLRRVMAQARRAQGDLDGAEAGFAEAARVAGEREAHGLTMEMEVDRGLALVEQGRIETGMERIEAQIGEADRRQAPINRVWAEAALAAARLRRSPRSPEAGAAVLDALTAAEEIGYPAGVSFGLRLRAEYELATDDLDATAATVVELLDILLERGGLDEMRYVLDLAAEVMRRRGDERWPDLLATAESMPITSFITPLESVVELDDEVDGDAERLGSGTVLTIREVYTLCREAMTDPGAARREPAASTPAPTPASEDGTGSTPGAEPEAAMVREGDVWRLTFAGATVRMRRSKGLADLAVLLAQPGREWSALDLTGALAVGGSGGEIIDAEARRAYEGRVRELQAEIDEAESDNDLARAERLRVELDVLVDQLTEAIGLGGRHRRVAGEAERARSAVTQRLRSTIRRLSDQHPDLGAHLANSVSTGSFCVYRPHPPVIWLVEG